MKGILNFYFPCKLRNSPSLRKLERRWQSLRKYQTNRIINERRPLTDLIFGEYYREQNESVLSEYQRVLNGEVTTVPPFASREIQYAYQAIINDYIFSKNVNVSLGKFIFFDPNEKSILNKNIKFSGEVLLNVNAENKVATFIVAVSFDQLNTDQCIYLKHLFYKHCIVNISKNGCELQTTLVDYVAACNPFRKSDIEEQIDFRCRYSYLEVDSVSSSENNCEEISIYGLLRADEGYEQYPSNPEGEAYQKMQIVRSFYQIYFYRYDVLLVRKNEKVPNPFNYLTKEGNIDINEEIKSHSHSIAGTCIDREFPNYLKSVEIHYLVNNETTNEIEQKERSYVKPWVFIKRAYKIWTILYEVDTNKYHISRKYLDSFGTTDLLAELREEYNSLLVHIVGFITSVLAFLTLFFTIVSVCK